MVGSVLALASQGLTQGCEGWNTSLFFLSATPAEVESCLAAGAEVNARSAGLGYTPLHWAVRFSDDPAVITTLLDAGAEATAQDLSGNTPWDYAKDREELESSDAYRRLSEASEVQAVAAECAEWNTLAFFQSTTLEGVIDCLNAGAEVNARNADGNTPLQFAAANSTDPTIIRILVGAGAGVNARDRAGFTPLHIAALTYADPAVITALLDAGADVNARDVDGNTPLHYAAVADTDDPAVIATTAILLDAGADVNAPNSSSYTPLYIAAFAMADPAVITALLDAGADVNARGADGDTPWDYIKDREDLKGSTAYQRLATQAAAADCEGWNTPEFFAFATPAEVRGCLIAGAWVNVRDDDGWTPLHLVALNSNDLAVIRTLLNAGAEVDAREGESGWTPLHVAAAGGDNPAFIQILVAAGAEVDAQDEAGYTPLHHAVLFNDDPAVITVLKNAGAWLEARTDYSSTPLHLAAVYAENPATITALLDAGADGAAQTNWGATPWDLAQENEALRGTDAWWRLREGSLD